jgi:beta-glucosidase
MTPSNRSITKRITELLDQMTPDEKLAQLGSYWIYELQTKGQLDQRLFEEKLNLGIGQITRLAGASTLDPRSAAKAANLIQHFLVENTRLGIPAILHEECCSGAMVLGGSTYPQMIGLASAFQPDLAERMTVAIREQLRAIGAHQGLAPVLDVSHDPRWGRVEETFGEDPTLVSHFGMAYIRGLQENTSSVIACRKAGSTADRCMWDRETCGRYSWHLSRQRSVMPGLHPSCALTLNWMARWLPLRAAS